MTKLTAVIFLLCMFGVAMSPATANQNPFSCTISAATHQRLIDGVNITFTIENHLASSVALLTWYTPIEGLLSNMFDVKNEAGNLLEYQGAMVKRAEPNPDDFITLVAHEKKQFNIDIAPAYAFTKSNYVISLIKNKIQYVTNGNSVLSNFNCDIPPITLTIN